MRPGFGLHRQHTLGGVLGALIVILVISTAAALRAPAAKAIICNAPTPMHVGTVKSYNQHGVRFKIYKLGAHKFRLIRIRPMCSQVDDCTIYTNTVVDRSTVDGSVGSISHYTCVDKTASIVSSQWLEEYIPFYSNFIHVNSFGATDHDGEAYMEHYTPCFPPAVKGAQFKYRVVYSPDVTFTDGTHINPPPFISGIRTITNCDADFQG